MLNCSKLLLAMIFVINSAVGSFAAEPAADKADSAVIVAITAAVKAAVTKEVIESVYVEKLVGDYALVIVTVKDGDGGMAFMKRGGSGWTLLNYGNAITEAALVGMGIPQDVAKKMAD